MKLQCLPIKGVAVAMRNGIHSNAFQVTSKLKLSNEESVERLLSRRWTLPSPETKIHQVIQRDRSDGCSFLLNTNPSFSDGIMDMDKEDRYFYIVRDDLLHPLVNGNKARKLDGLLPLLEDYSVTDVDNNSLYLLELFQPVLAIIVTCGGCQSAHTAAVAVLCAERGIKSHLLLRGEQPEIMTGYNLMSTIYGNVTYVPRSIYAKREDMLKSHAKLVADDNGSVVWFNDIIEAASITKLCTSPKLAQVDANRSAENHHRKILIINEGAGDSVALLGVIRLVQYLSENNLFGRKRALKFVVDAGTGTTAIGLGLAALCLGLPWEVYAVMLADTIDGYRQKEECLISEFKKHYAQFIDHGVNKADGRIVHWVERCRPRKFGNVMEGEMQACQQIAQQTGILVDPVYTLAAWELATLLCNEEAEEESEVVMLHTGGTLGLFGLAQRTWSGKYFILLSMFGLEIKDEKRREGKEKL
ncbi:D-cysteine desulfhydrase 2, mitochondrial isoform X1 [Senna tora]|uniref:D-cysteine desulfhydrase 2, mitochondrial isoform X1 n=1 Tax=Senna tora TaxID=362788 RepID=A0A834X9A5_9FABA|nr:D-cysteine desulfhydrase 2, mitochondrial isoform X1 [Senna tora]